MPRLSSSIALFAILSFFSAFQLCYSKRDYLSISLNSSQTIELSPNRTLFFKTLPRQNDTTENFGTFNISFEPFENKSSALISINREKCIESARSIKHSFVQDLKSEHFSYISFFANASEAQCFQIKFSQNPGTQITVAFTVKVTHTPLNILLEANRSYYFDFAEESEKVFAYKSQDAMEVIQITIQERNKIPAGNSLQLVKSFGKCLQTSKMMSWLCYLSDPSNVFGFTIYNSSNMQTSYEMLVTKVPIQQITPETMRLTVNSTIMNFGTIFSVTLPDRGVLKIQPERNHSSLISCANSLLNLFNTLAQEPGHIYSEDINNKEGLVLQNKKSGTQWFFFIPNKNNQPFSMEVNFFKQSILELEKEEIYYLDPAVYPFQHIQVNLGSRHLPEKFEISLRSLVPGGLMALYFDTNAYDSAYSSFPNEFHYIKKASSLSGLSEDTSELSLSFIMGPNDCSVYVTIHGLNKGLYVIQVTKRGFQYSTQVIFLLILVIGMIVCFILCLAASNRRTNEFQDFYDMQEFVPVDSDLNNENFEQNISSEIQIVTDSAAATSEITNEVSNIKFVKMLRKLKKLESNFCLSNYKEHMYKEASEVNEDNRCDICYEMKKTVRFEPCQHSCACTFCASIIIEQSAKCPLCRGKISKIKITSDFDKRTKESENQDNFSIF